MSGDLPKPDMAAPVRCSAWFGQTGPPEPCALLPPDEGGNVGWRDAQGWPEAMVRSEGETGGMVTSGNYRQRRVPIPAPTRLSLPHLAVFPSAGPRLWSSPAYG